MGEVFAGLELFLVVDVMDLRVGVGSAAEEKLEEVDGEEACRAASSAEERNYLHAMIWFIGRDWFMAEREAMKRLVQRRISFINSLVETYSVSVEVKIS